MIVLQTCISFRSEISDIIVIESVHMLTAFSDTQDEIITTITDLSSTVTQYHIDIFHALLGILEISQIVLTGILFDHVGQASFDRKNCI